MLLWMLLGIGLYFLFFFFFLFFHYRFWKYIKHMENSTLPIKNDDIDDYGR